MVRRRLNPKASPNNAFVATTAGSRDSGVIRKTVVEISTLTGIVFKDSEGVTRTVAVSPAVTTLKAIQGRIEDIFTENGFVIGNRYDSGVNIVADGGGFIVTVKGEVEITSISAQTPESVDVIEDNYL
jgi:hypothetical protein